MSIPEIINALLFIFGTIIGLLGFAAIVALVFGKGDKDD